MDKSLKVEQETPDVDVPAALPVAAPAADAALAPPEPEVAPTGAHDLALSSRTPVYPFSFNVDQKPGQGEDADPTLAVHSEISAGVLAVFDGMGGAGATQYRRENKSRTGAYLASRLAKDVLEVYFCGDGLPSWPAGSVQQVADGLRDNLVAAFRKEVSALDTESGTRLSGTMMRRLPTTLACLYFREYKPEVLAYDVFWAGDSRVYLLTPTRGMQQLSTDDLRSRGDALQNLIEDSPVSNCIDADTAFAINVLSGEEPVPAVFIAATDGCFNYGLTPAHFEHAVLSALDEATDAATWKENAKVRMQAVAGDDLSMALVAIGWPDFGALKQAFARRLTHVRTRFVEPVDNIQEKIKGWEEDRRAALVRRDELRQELWTEYRDAYEAAAKNYKAKAVR